MNSANGNDMSADERTAEVAVTYSASADLENGMASRGTDLATTIDETTMEATTEDSKMVKRSQAWLQSLDMAPEA